MVWGRIRLKGKTGESIEKAVKELSGTRLRVRRMAREEGIAGQGRQVAVVGAGPIGLEAALRCRLCGLAVTVYEQGEVGEYLQQWGHVRLFTPWGWNVTPLGLQVLQQEYPRRQWPSAEHLLTGWQYREEYLLPLAESEWLKGCVRPRTQVVQIGPSRDGRTWRLLLHDANGVEQHAYADVVLDCSGIYGQPRWLGEGDVPALGERAARAHIPHGVVDISGTHRGRYAGKSVLVVGGGYSAASNVVALASLAEQHAETWVYWVHHGPRGQPLPRIPHDPLPERDRLAARANMLAARGDGHVEYFAQTVLHEVRYLGPEGGFYVAGHQRGQPVAWNVEQVIAAVGYRAVPLSGFVPELPDRPYYVLGSKSQPRSFLLAEGHRQLDAVLGRLIGPSYASVCARVASKGKRAA